MSKEASSVEDTEARSAMKLALEALKWFTAAEPWDEPDVSKAIKALEEALAKQEQGEQLAKLGWQEIDCPICGGGARAFPKQEQGEPVAYLVTGPYEKQPFANINSAKAYREGLNKGFGEDAYTISNLYTTPQQPPTIVRTAAEGEDTRRAWVGLTAEDKQAFIDQDFGGNRLDAMDYAEKILKEKNTNA